MKVDAKSLLAVVNQTLAGCRNNDEDKKNLLFTGGYVYSWSPALSVSAKLPADCAGLDGVVCGKDIVLFLSRLGAVEVDVECTDRTWEFSTGNLSASITLRDEEGIRQKVSRLVPEGAVYRELPANFRDCLSICDIPNNAYKMGGVYISGANMLSTDNNRVNTATLSSEFAGTVLLSCFSVAEILRLKVKFTHYVVDRRWVHFLSKTEEADMLTFSCNRLDDSCYPYDRYAGLVSKCVDAREWCGVLPNMDRAIALAQCFDDTLSFSLSTVPNIITLTFTDGNIIVASERSASGKCRQVLPYADGSTTGIKEPVTVKVSAPFLSSALRNTNRFSIVSVGRNSLLLLTGTYFSTCVQVMV